MQRNEYYKFFRTCFKVFPFKDNGIIEHLNGSKEFVDKNGYRKIRDANNNVRMVSQIIYAVGCSYPIWGVRSYQYMKNVTISYKDRNKNNCNFDNLICKTKRSFLKKVKNQKAAANYI